MVATLTPARARARGVRIAWLAGAALAAGLLPAAFDAPPAAAQGAPPAAAQVRARYETSAKFATVRDILQRHKVLEKAAILMSPLRLPRELTIRAAQCDAPALPYDAASGTITICYEAIANVMDLAKGASSNPDELARLVTGGVIEETLHAIAAAVLQVYDIPVWGREEDAADLLGAFLMLKFDERAARVAMTGAATLFMSATSALGKVDYVADVSPPAQRFYNFLCIAYGGDRLDFHVLVDKGFLPEHRANRCQDEYNSIRKAFDLRVMPHIDPDLAVKVRAIDWLAEEKN
jgi:hypothetical protein